MFTGGPSNNNSAGKRKMNHVDAADQTANQLNLFNLHSSGPRLFASPPPPPPPATANQFNPFNLHGGGGGRTLFASPTQYPPPPHASSQVQQILNNMAPTVRPFSFMSLLNATGNNNNNEEVEEEDPLVTEIRSQADQVNHILSLHTDMLKQSLNGMLERHHKSIHRVPDEKLKQLEAELRMKSAHINDLEVRAEHYKREADRLSARVSYLETKTMSLKSRLEYANEARRYGEAAREDGDSSTEDNSDKAEAVVGPVRFDCKACDKQLATMLMWPCRHVCVCKQCDGVIERCPVCRVEKISSVEVFHALKED